MSSSSVLVFGLLYSSLFVTSCVVLNAEDYYNEIKIESGNQLNARPTLVLRDRTPQKNYEPSPTVWKE